MNVCNIGVASSTSFSVIPCEYRIDRLGLESRYTGITIAAKRNGIRTSEVILSSEACNPATTGEEHRKYFLVGLLNSYF
jgi:hypothetical protein